MKWMITLVCFAFLGLSSLQAQSKKELYRNKQAKEVPQKAEKKASKEVNAPPKAKQVRTQSVQPQSPQQPAQPTAPAKAPKIEEKKPMEAEVEGTTEERVPGKTLEKKLKKKPAKDKK
jgi:hypothetical protein